MGRTLRSVTAGAVRRLRALAHRLGAPPAGTVDFGDLRRATPISKEFGFDRGTPIDRHYIEGFLAESAADIRGRVLEIGDDRYTRRFGGAKVTHGDVLHIQGGVPGATIVADLSDAPQIADGTFDCAILTQTLQFVRPVESVIAEVHRILAPGGTALVTFAGISQISRYDMDRWGDYWRFTSLSARLLFEAAFAGGEVAVSSRGNVLAAISFLHGLSSEELSTAELARRDPDYEVSILVRARKAAR